MTGRRTASLALLSALVGAGALQAQSRNERIAAAFTAYDNFQPDQALELLTRAVNPSDGPQDSLWFRGVQLLAQILIERDRSDDATGWLRWALRLAPDARLDTLNFVPEVVTAARAARSVVAGGSPGDSVTRTTWQWTAPGAGEGRGMLRIESPGMAQPVRALVQGSGVTESGRTVTLAAGTYEVQAAAEGYLTAQVRREVLPGVTTVLSFNLTPVAPAVAPPAAAATLTEATRASVLRQLAPFTVSRFGGESACGPAAFTGRSGLLLTTYQAIRGADRVEIEVAGGRRLADEVRVAAYDVDADMAVLQIPTIRGDSLPLATSLATTQPVWGFGFADCRTPGDQRLGVASAGLNTLQLADSVGPAVGPLVNANGSLVGYVTGGRTAVSASRIGQVLDQARRNLASGAVLAVGEVALRENHAFGSVAISSDLAGAEVRVTPLETWQWPETAASGPLPLTFTGPMGRYHVQLRVGGQVRAERDFTVRPAVADRLSVTLPTVAAPPPQPVPSAPQAKKGGGKTGIILGVVGLAGVGAAVAVLAGKKSNGGGTTIQEPGSITISVPNPSVFGTILRIVIGRH